MLMSACAPQAADESRQLQGLKALQGLARNAAMFLPLQAVFREAGGFPLLVCTSTGHQLCWQW